MADVWPTLARKKDKGQRLTYTDAGEPKGCLHTTESSDWPGYRGWKVNPHITVKPIPGKGIDAECNVPLNYASFALRNEAGGVQTNRDNVVQFELIGTCEKGGPGYFWPEADDAVLLALAELIVEISRLRGIPMRCLPFESYPDSYGKGNGVRLSGAEFDRYSGWLGHQHVVENSHGDPGAFPWARMLRLHAEKHKPAKPAPAPSGGVVQAPSRIPVKPTPAHLVITGKLDAPTIRRLQQVLGTPVDGVISKPRSTVVEALQKFLNAHGAKLVEDGAGLNQDGREYKTVRALQKYLRTPQDGVLSTPKSAAVAELQRRLNRNRL